MTTQLQKSIDHYRRIIDHAKLLEELLRNNEPEQLRNYTTQLRAMQEEAGLHDRELLKEIALNTEQWQAHPLFQERLKLLQQIIEMNNLLLPRIRGIMSVASAELSQVKDGRVAVAGYHPATSQNGSVRSIG